MFTHFKKWKVIQWLQARIVQYQTPVLIDGYWSVLQTLDVNASYSEIDNSLLDSNSWTKITFSCPRTVLVVIRQPYKYSGISSTYLTNGRDVSVSLIHFAYEYTRTKWITYFTDSKFHFSYQHIHWKNAFHHFM